MNGLDDNQAALLHAALEQRKLSLLGQLATASGDVQSATDGAPAAGVVSRKRQPAVEEIETSPADSASNRTLNELLQETAAHSLVQLGAVRRALAKFGDASYGLCENCGSEIGYSRLNARPEASLCIACQTRIERRQR